MEARQWLFQQRFGFVLNQFDPAVQRAVIQAKMSIIEFTSQCYRFRKTTVICFHKDAEILWQLDTGSHF